MPKYEIYTNISRDFDPDIEGVTIDSIMKTVESYVRHSVPDFTRNNETLILLEVSGPLERDYVTGQLNGEFGDPGRPVVTRIREVTR